MAAAAPDIPSTAYSSTIGNVVVPSAADESAAVEEANTDELIACLRRQLKPLKPPRPVTRTRTIKAQSYVPGTHVEARGLEEGFLSTVCSG